MRIAKWLRHTEILRSYQAAPTGIVGRDEALQAGVATIHAWREAAAAAAAPGELPAPYDPDAVYACQVKPGDCVVNPNAGWGGDDRETLDVMHVTGPDSEGMVFISAPGGPAVRVAMDWGLERYTPARADLEALILMEEGQ